MLSAPPPIAMSAIAQHDRLRRRNDRLQPAATQAVHRQARRLLADAAVQSSHAREVHVLGLGVDHVAKDDVADLPAVDTRALERFGDHDGAELGGWHVLETPAERPDGGSGPADNDDFAHLLLPQCFAASAPTGRSETRILARAIPLRLTWIAPAPRIRVTHRSARRRPCLFRSAPSGRPWPRTEQRHRCLAPPRIRPSRGSRPSC